MALQEITMALSALKVSSEVIRAVVSTDKALAVADLKLRLADAMTSVFDARTALLDAQEKVDAKDAEIARLHEALSNRTKVIRNGSAYYDATEEGAPIGHAYCMRCYETEHRLFHLAYPNSRSEPARCPVCRTEYAYGHTRRIAIEPS